MKPEFNETIHAPNRLKLCAILAAGDVVEFAIARDLLSVSDSVLSKQVKILRDAGYVRVTKVRESKPQTWLSLTKAGRSALDAHLAELTRIAQMADG